MDAGKAQFTKFISGETILIIPVYQRNYDWKEENCKQLFNDIVRIIETGKPHFIGTFVYQYKPTVKAPQEYVIIDGQQRITSIILFAKALYDLSDDDELKADIRAKYLKHTTGKNLKNKCRLRPNEFDRATFEKIMADDFDESNFTPDEKLSSMYRNYRFFREKISAATATTEELCDTIDQLQIVFILLEGENPQEIFESLNSTGLDLTQADLIRNFLLMPLAYDEQEELYKQYWLAMEKLLRLSNNMENFLVQYLVTKRKSDSVMATNKQRLSSRNLYAVFKNYFDDNFSAAAEECLKDLFRYAKFFSRFIFDADTNFENLSALDKKFYELVYLLDANNAPIILMYLLDRYGKKHFDEATFIKFVDAMISLTFRAKVCKHTGINPQFAGNVLARLDKEKNLDEKIFWRILTFGKGTYSFPNDKDFQDALTNNELFKKLKSHGCKYLLYSLERAAETKGATELPPFSNPTIEHIWPQELNDDWKKYLEKHNDLQAYGILLHTLGNLTLLSGANNSSNGNAPFDDKKKIYAQSNYPYTRALAEYKEWTAAQIQLRAQKLAAAAVNIWKLPKEFNFVLQSPEKFFNLDSDFSELKGSKPSTLFIGNTEINMPHWNHLLREIVRQLYELDSNIFRKATQMQNVRKNLFMTESKDSTEFKLDENFYMATGFSAEDCLKYSKVLVENFDSLGDTNFKDEISFTLKRK